MVFNMVDNIIKSIQKKKKKKSEFLHVGRIPVSLSAKFSKNRLNTGNRKKLN